MKYARCPSWFLTALINHHDQKLHGEERVYCFKHPIQSLFFMEVKAGTKVEWNLETRTEAQNMMEGCLLTCSHDLLSMFFYNLKPFTQGCSNESEWAFSHQSLIKKKNVLIDLVTIQFV